MPTIVFASPKGGVGKSTSALLLSIVLAESGRTVALIDADPNRPAARWAKRPNRPATLEVLSDITEETVITTIERAAATHYAVIVDLEGIASMMVAYAISRADLVIIPTQGSQLDATEAVKAIRLVRKQEEAFRLSIPAAILFTRTSAAIRPRSLQSIEAEFAQNGVPVFETQVIERDAYRALFSFGGTLRTLDPSAVRNIGPAIANAEAFTAEVMAHVAGRGQGRAVA